MALDKASQGFNTGPPNYAASEVTAFIEEVRKKGKGMEVVIRLSNTPQNSGGFFPRYTVTVTVNGSTKKRGDIDVFPDNDKRITFTFSKVGSIQVEANPGRNVESLMLSASAPDFADIQEPKVSITTSENGAGVMYTLVNKGGRSGTATVNIEVSGKNIQTTTKSAEKTVPAKTDISDTAVFEFDNTSPVEATFCVELE